MTDINRSPLAILAPNMRDPAGAPRRTPWGFLLHTTGRNVVEQAAKLKVLPRDNAFRYYRSSQRDHWGSAHYLIDHDGTIYQMAPDDVEIAHCGKKGARTLYRTPWRANPEWHKKVPYAAVKHWLRQWGDKYNDPFDLFPHESPNTDYVGAEMLAVAAGFGVPAFPGALHTEAQHVAATRLARDLARRHGWPGDWHRTSRLVGHEDIQPQARSTSAGCWDPGWLRDAPYFDFARVRRDLDVERAP